MLCLVEQWEGRHLGLVVQVVEGVCVVGEGAVLWFLLDVHVGVVKQARGRGAGRGVHGAARLDE